MLKVMRDVEVWSDSVTIVDLGVDQVRLVGS